MKPYYDKNNITIYCGECSQVLKQFPDLHFDLTITSPPYDFLREYKGYTFDFAAISAQLWRVTGKGGVVVWVVADQTVNGSETGTSFRQALGFMELGYRLHDTMIYKTNKPPYNDRRYEQEFEYMFVFARGKLRIFNGITVPVSEATKHRRRTPHIKTYQKEPDGSTRHKRAPNKTHRLKGNVWFYSAKSHQIKLAHPAPFPEALARDHILSWSKPGDLVLDPMAGSGTVGKMALELGRRCVLIDVSKEYCDIMVERLRQPSFFSIPAADPTPLPPQQLKLLTGDE